MLKNFSMARIIPKKLFYVRTKQPNADNPGSDPSEVGFGIRGQTLWPRQDNPGSDPSEVLVLLPSFINIKHIFSSSFILSIVIVLR
jgi:hypothetical protein